MRVAANKYNIIQVGLALFIPKNMENFETFSKETYEVRSYKYICFPKRKFRIFSSNFLRFFSDGI